MPLKRKDFYKCSDPECTAIVEIISQCDCDADCKITCCDKAMDKMDEKSADFKTEKHVPVVEKVDGGFKVTVGSTAHPMTEEHYIQMIELGIEGRFCRVYLKPGDAPEAFFAANEKCCGESCEMPVAREICNVHGLWTNKG